MIFLFEILQKFVNSFFERAFFLVAGNPVLPPLGEEIERYQGGGGSSLAIWVLIPFALYFWFKDLFKSEEEKKKEKEEETGCFIIILVIIGIGMGYYFFFR